MLTRLICVLTILIAGPLYAQTPVADTLPSCTAHRIQQAPKIDGKLTEAEWLHVSIDGGFRQFRPEEGKEATQRTAISLLYTDFALYVGVKCFDTAPDSILKQLGARDNEDLNADNFFIKLDCYNNQQDAFQFGVSASGVQFDSKFSDYTFDAVWNSAVAYDAEGWTVEMEIPYSALRFPMVEEQLWGVQFTRLLRRRREQQQWAYVPSIASNPQLYWGHISGISRVKTPLRLSMTPYVAYNYNHSPVFREDGSYRFADQHAYNFGADIKYGIDDRFTLDMTLLPDFGQVQSDPLVKNLTYREVVFDENRPFFKEATELFSKGDLFYSRRIGRIPSGYFSVSGDLAADELIVENQPQVKLLNSLKISGRTDKGLGIGVFNALTDNAYAIAENQEGQQRQLLTEPLTNYSILVLDQQFKNNSNIYFVNASTLRQGHYTDANVNGAGVTLSNKKNTFQLKGDGTLTQRFITANDAGSSSVTTVRGYRYSFGADKLGGNFIYGLYRNVTSPEYDATDLGFFRVAGQNSTEAYLRFNRYRPWKFIRESYNRLSVNITDDFKTGKISNNSVDLRLFVNLMSWNAIFAGSGFQPFRPYDFYEARTPGIVYHGLRSAYYYIGYSTDYRKPVAIDYSINFEHLLDRFTATSQYHSLGLRLRPSDRLFMVYSLDYNFAPFNVGYATTTDQGEPLLGGRRVDTWTNRLEANYSFSYNSGLRIIARHYWISGKYKQLFSLDEAGELVPKYDYAENINFNYNVFNVDVIYQWIFTPGSVLNIVYKINLSNESEIVSYNYRRNFDQLLQEPGASTIAIKFLYFLDYLKVHGKIGKRYFHPQAENRGRTHQSLSFLPYQSL